MYNTREELEGFFRACDALACCPFERKEEFLHKMMETLLQGEFLSSVVAYAKKGIDPRTIAETYIRRYPSATRVRLSFILPEQNRERLVVLLYLLEPIEENKISFDDFLDLYFYHNKGLYESFIIFRDAVLEPLRSTVSKVVSEFVRRLYHPEQDLIHLQNSRNSGTLNRILDLLELEYYRTAKYPFRSQEEREQICKMLDQMNRMTVQENVDCLEALLFGYGYFLSSVRVNSECMQKVILLLKDLI